MKCHRLTLLILILTCSTLWAQSNDWTVVYLHPDGANESQAFAAAGRQQAGYKSSGGNNADAHPILWNSKKNGFVDLLPKGLRLGIVYGMDQSQVGKIVGIGTDTWGIIWYGSADDSVVMDPPPGYADTLLTSVKEVEQVGQATFWETGRTHAAIWHGTGDSFVDVHPSIANWSKILATDGEFQGGDVKILRPKIQIHGALWHGTAESFVDMHPTSAKESHILGMAPGVQVGWAWFGTLHKALLWHGTPESAVVMHPSEAYYSYLLATNGTTHAGYITHFGSCAEAGLWTGDDPESFFNLSVYLPSDWRCSTANAISESKGRLYVAGTAESPEGALEAVLWIGPAKPKSAKPEPLPTPTPRP